MNFQERELLRYRFELFRNTFSEKARHPSPESLQVLHEIRDNICVPAQPYRGYRETFDQDVECQTVSLNALYLNSLFGNIEKFNLVKDFLEYVLNYIRMSN